MRPLAPVASAEQMANIIGAPGAREFGENLASIGQNFRDELRLARRYVANRCRVVPRAGGKKPLDSVKLDRNSPPFEQCEHVPAAPSRSQRDHRRSMSRRVSSA